MAFSIITLPATDRFIGALCNTLVHSLWQGLILSAITGLIILLTRKRSPAMRYNLLISALVLFAVGVGVTFAMQMEPAHPLLPDAVTVVGNHPASVGAIQISIAAPTQSFADSLFGYLNQHHNAIVTAWFLIICARSIQLIVGLLGVRRLKRTKVHQVSIEWHHRLQQLANSLAIKQSVALLESGLAKVPMVIGTLKPVILIPIGLITALSTQEVEAILVHELAHIKRRDYLVNLLQNLMEIVFFFNPAVLWISQLIKAERENCCDDMAIAHSSNKVSYIRALVSCEEYQASVPAYAIALAGNKNSLMNRVKRMMNNRNHTLNMFEKTALAVCLVVAGLCVSAFAKKAQREYIADTVAQVISNIQKQNAEKSEKQELNQELKKPQENDKVSDKATADINETPKRQSADKSNYAGSTPDSSKNRVNINLDLDSLNIQLAAMKFNPKLKLDTLKIHMAPMKLNLNMNINPAPNANAGPKVSVNIDTPQKVQYSVESNLKYGPNDVALQQNYNTRTHLKYTPNTTIYGKPRYSNISFAVRDTTKRDKIKVEKKFDLGDALYDAHLIKDKKNYKVVLNDKELVVNGVKQPEDVHQTFLKYYIKKAGDHINMTVGVTTTE